MRTLGQLINFPVDLRLGNRADGNPTPEEQAVVIGAYAKHRWSDDADYQPFDRLPFKFGYTFVDDRERRWKILHEVALLWLFHNGIIVPFPAALPPRDGNEPQPTTAER